MKKLIQIFPFPILSLFLLCFVVNSDLKVESSFESEAYSLDSKASKAKADELIKQLTISFVASQVQEFLMQVDPFMSANSEDFAGLPATCFAPNTDPAVVDAFYRNRTVLANSLGLPAEGQNSRFNIGSRWGTTATNGSGLGQGDVTTLTWSYVPDGTAIGNGGCGVPDQGTFSSDFITFFNGIYGGPTTPGDFTTAPWHNVFVGMFNSWSNVSGLIFVYEPNDDGVTVVTGGAGIAGVRGDFRISGHRLDGNSNVLACNYFPNNGDMIIDTSDNFFSNNPGIGTTNVLTHEIGHGLGIQHVCPVVQTKLMEPFVTTAFAGPQEDDVLATNRHYGDPEGLNDTSGAAVFLGSNANPITYDKMQRSIDDNADVDYFSFTIANSTVLSGTLTPTGTTYLSGVQLGNGNCTAGTNFNALTVSDLQFEILDTDGTTILASGNVNGVGVNENLANVNLPVAGMYFVRVSQQGTSVNNVQMYDLSISLQNAVTTPEISFAAISGAVVENTDCSFTDHLVDLNIGTGPSADAEVTFSIDGASTAVQGLDYDLMNASVIFPTGSAASQQMILRVYHDGLVEIDETIIVNITLNANGGDATLNAVLDTFTLTINNDDVTPVGSVTSTLYTEDFEDITGWLNIDDDADGQAWLFITGLDGIGDFVGRGIGSVANDAAIGGTGILFNPENYLVSEQMSIPAGTINTAFTYSVYGASSSLEFYTLRWTTDISSIAAINAGQLIEERFATANTVDTRTVNVNNIAGQTGYFVMIHDNPAPSTSSNGLLVIDTLIIDVTVGSDVQTAVNSGTPDQISLPASGLMYSSDPISGDIMLSIQNNNTHDYGCVDISVSRAGNGAQGYNGSTGADRVTDKTFAITPSNVAGTGDTSITFYFTEAEILGWEGLTGLDRNSDLIIGRGNPSAISETSTTTIGAFGANVAVTGNFTALNGTYYFGSAGSFIVSCTGATKTWDGSSWSPIGNPNATNPVVINGNYDTGTDGDLEACTVTINALVTLTVDALDYMRSQGNITVNGTLIVEHTGSVVQVDKDASVTNSGTINVELTSPVLQTRDFMVLGSPMSGETRADVFSSAFLVLNHTPNNFIPHSGVPMGGTNFADDDNDFWNAYAGNITVGEGYIVRPQSGFTDPANHSYSMTYTKGTLNNGDVSRPIIYDNIPANINPDGTPNVLANPYASAISASSLITANALINEVYFWEHLTPPSAIPGGGSINFSMGDISMYNISGGTKAANDLSPGEVTKPNGVISTAQGFGIKAFGNGTVSFNNTMRLTSGNTTLRNPENTDRIWLNLKSNEYKIGSSVLIAFNPEATPQLDPGYDSNRLATAIALYSHLEDGSAQLGIQTREGFTSGVEISMGFTTQIDADIQYNISIADIEGDHLSNATVYLTDHIENTVTNLSEENYSFTSGKETFNQRFTIRFEEEVLGAQENDIASSIAIIPNPTKGLLSIISPKIGIKGITIYDTQGRLVNKINLNTQASYQIDISTLKSGMYFVNLQTETQSITKKVIKK